MEHKPPGRYLRKCFSQSPLQTDPDPKLLPWQLALRTKTASSGVILVVPRKKLSKDGKYAGVEDGSDGDSNTPFLHAFLTYLYSDNLPNSCSKVGKNVTKFICRLQQLNILSGTIILSDEKVKNIKEYTPSLVASQLGAELKRNYRHGSVQFSEKKPAIIVFVYLNAVAGNPWSLIPLSSAKNGFMTFTEIELGAFFQKREDLHPELKSLINHRDRGRRLTQAEVINNWFPLQAPGLFIKHFIAPVDPRLADGKRLRGRMKKKAGIAAAFKVLIPSEIRAHVNLLQSDDFDPRNYTEKSYVLLGSIKTERYELQVSACKLRELNSVKYKRYPSERLPDHPFTTIAGTDNYLTEARNVFKNRDDVEQLLGCIADMVHTISYLGIDPGQACIVGSLATLLSDKEPRICRRRNRRKRKKNKRGIRRRNPRGKRQRKPRDIDSRHINISTKQKPVALPTLRDRKWMENRKCTTLVEPGYHARLWTVEDCSCG
ncbi:hypothetical protein BGX21_007959 [Mortierella sp. AD011]|nr:hypothetical protein BGX21_007959 [Mortierella sp. AD011]